MYRTQEEVTAFASLGVTFGEIVAGDGGSQFIRADGSGGTPPPPPPPPAPTPPSPPDVGGRKAR